MELKDGSAGLWLARARVTKTAEKIKKRPWSRDLIC
jgi:hypothetical protein